MEQTSELRDDALMYRRIEAQQIQRELEHLKDKIEAIKLEAMNRIYEQREVQRD
jgi:hypothetical protein